MCKACRTGVRRVRVGRRTGAKPELEILVVGFDHGEALPDLELRALKVSLGLLGLLPQLCNDVTHAHAVKALLEVRAAAVNPQLTPQLLGTGPALWCMRCGGVQS